jgi:[FeFe] hydrogenase H-cluster maturation GTPase HydF
MEQTPKSLRLHIGLFGRTNVGKSSFLNLLCGQEVAVTSDAPGTTTDVVVKSAELLPVGPVVFLDTAGLDDTSSLAVKRLDKTIKIFDRAEVFVCIMEPDAWTTTEDAVISEAKKRALPLIIVINKADLKAPSETFLSACRQHTALIMTCSSIDGTSRQKAVEAFKSLLLKATADAGEASIPLVSDLVPPGGLAVLVTPIDLQAPRGRLILPQVQTIRDALDGDACVAVVKEREYAHLLTKLSVPPDLVVCDSQVVMKVVADTPENIPCTTFSILFSRYKGDLIEQVKGLSVIDNLKNNDRVLIAEACSHHALADDIGRVKIPRWLRQYTGANLTIDVSSGHDYPQNLADYALIVHCGSCMLTRRETAGRIGRAAALGVPITNYGLCIAMIQGVLQRALSPFPAALDAFGFNKRNFLSR